MSVPGDLPVDKRSADRSGAVSRPSLNNRQGPRESLNAEDLAIAAEDVPGEAGLRPLSVEAGRQLRDEAVHDVTGGPQARPVYAVISEWRDWYHGYQNAHIEYEGPDGETGRTQLENSYMPRYGKRYYAKLKDFERATEREYADLTTVMVTLSASTENANGGPRCPADHMRDIMDGYDAARKQLHQTLSGRNWEYARVWEPHESGYGHLHIAVFVEDDGDTEISADTFAPVMRSHVENCGPAGWEAHRPDGDAVSINRDVNNLGTYISEYIGIFGEEAIQRPMNEQMFYATCWATGTRRVDFSNGAHEMMARERFRRETGLRPEDRGEAMRQRESDSEAAHSDSEATQETGHPDEGDGWSVDRLCHVSGTTPEYSDPTTGGTDTTAIEGRSGFDPPPHRE
jgi:hypothetical protein